MSDASGRERPQTRRRKSLSDKQLAILEVIQRSIARHGYPPSMREIGDAVGLKSLSSVTHQLNQLELSGYLRRDAGKTRAMEVLIDLPGTATESPADIAPSVGDAALVPLVGRIAAGVPITAEQQVEEIFPLPRQLVGKGELFILKGVFETKVAIALIASSGIALAAFYALRMYQRTMHNPLPDEGESRELALREAVVLVPLVACIVGLALYPGLVTTRGEAAVDRSLAAL